MIEDTKSRNSQGTPPSLPTRPPEKEIQDLQSLKKSAEERHRFESLLFELSARYVNLPPDKVDSEIEKGLSLIVKFLDIDRGNLYELAERGTSLHVTHSYANPGLPTFEGVDVDASFSWTAERLRRGEIISLTKHDDLPDEAIFEKRFWLANGLKSMLGLPLVVGGSILGALTFACIRSYHSWSDELIRQLRLVGEVFGNALMRKRAQQQIDELLQFEQLVSRISATYINSPADGVDPAIEEGLKQIGKFLGADRCNLLQFSEEERSFHRAHVWTAEGIKELPVSTKYHQLPWLGEEWRSGRAVRFKSPDDLPDEASIDKQKLQKVGTKSLVSVPLSAGESTFGVLAITTVRTHRAWSEHLTQRLQLLGEIFANALARKNADLELQNAFTEIKSLKDRLKQENIYLKKEIKLRSHPEGIIGQSDSIKQVLRQVEQVAKTEATVLVLGETGTGKELIAHAIHNQSARKKLPMVEVNCAAFSPTLIENELFGREKGAYTGATSQQIGRFELADQSTIFLDEIGELPPDLQAKLLKVIEEGKFERLGSTKIINVKLRVIAATNRDLNRAVREGRFREDLFFRLSVFPILVPPLRERTEDIPLLVQAFVNKFGKTMGKRIKRIPRRTMQALQRYPWPGNIRELKNLVERAMITSENDVLEVPSPHVFDSTASHELTLEDTERRHILKILEKTSWRVSGKNGAAGILGLKSTTLEYKMKKLGISRP
jgi:formate hydrogenlyase transcriptional activator